MLVVEQYLQQSAAFRQQVFSMQKMSTAVVMGYCVLRWLLTNHLTNSARSAGMLLQLHFCTE